VEIIAKLLFEGICVEQYPHCKISAHKGDIVVLCSVKHDLSRKNAKARATALAFFVGKCADGFSDMFYYRETGKGCCPAWGDPNG